MVLVEMVGIIIVMVERIKIKEGEMVNLALGVFNPNRSLDFIW